MNINNSSMDVLIKRSTMVNNNVFDQLLILENIHHGVIITDVRGHITYWNSASEKILGYLKKDVMGKPVRMFYADEEEFPFKKILKDCVEEKMAQGRWHAIHKNGRKVWLDIKVNVLTDSHENPMCCVITICDIGNQKFTEDRLKKNMAISQAIFDTSVDALITINKKGIIETVNRSVMKMFGYKKHELVGENVKILMPFPHSHNHDDYIRNYLNTGEKKIIGIGREVYGIKKDGTVFPIELSVSEVIWESHRIFAGIIRDLTERRKLERRILEIGNEERQQIGRELHDGLGQMLTGIRMLSESLARKLKANALTGVEEIEEISKMIGEADEYARKLSRGMVLVELERNGLSVALENLCKRTSKLAGINCEYRLGSNNNIESVIMAQHLYRIAQESVSNALKHSEAKNVTVWLSSNDQHTSLIVDDDGKGFDKKKIEQSEQGAGLKIMKHRAGVLGGFLDFKRTEQGFTRIRCVVPNNLEHFE